MIMVQLKFESANLPMPQSGHVSDSRPPVPSLKFGKTGISVWVSADGYCSALPVYLFYAFKRHRKCAATSNDGIRAWLAVVVPAHRVPGMWDVHHSFSLSVGIGAVSVRSL